MSAAPNRPAPAPNASRTPRMSLDSIVKRTNSSSLRILLHGLEGVGKTTFAADAPNPVFICPEDGIPRALGPVPHFPAPSGDWTFDDVLDAVRSLAGGNHEYKTLVLDTVDWLEPLLWGHVCRLNSWKDIEEPGFGKGYDAALDSWRQLISDLEHLRRVKQMNVIMLAHTTIKQYKNPVGEDYDRFVMKLNQKAVGLLREWCDAVLFACHDDMSAKDTRTKRVRGVSTGERIVHTVHHAAYDAKNRFDLPETMPLSWDEFYAAVNIDPKQRAAEITTQIEASLGTMEQDDIARARTAMDRAGGDVGKLAKLASWCAGRPARKE